MEKWPQAIYYNVSIRSNISLLTDNCPPFCRISQPSPRWLPSSFQQPLREKKKKKKSRCVSTFPPWSWYPYSYWSLPIQSLLINHTFRSAGFLFWADLMVATTGDVVRPEPSIHARHSCILSLQELCHVLHTPSTHILRLCELSPGLLNSPTGL